MIRAAFIALLFTGCVASRPTPRATWEPIQMELGAAVWLVRVDGHDYLFTTRGNRGGLVHSASCPHSSHQP